MIILITGATGLIGQSLVKSCLDNRHTVHYLTTSKNKLENSQNYKGFYWNPRVGDIDLECFKGVGCIVHLAGDRISKRWTRSRKESILESRTKTADLLYDSLKRTEHNVRQFVSASGIGIYPASLTKLYTEESQETADSFLGEVVVAWEAAADRFKELGIDVAKIRTGMVLSRDGGALPAIMKPVKLGVGAPLASGKQWQSWIHIHDMSRVYLQVIENEWEGIFNAVAPTPVTNKKLTQLIARRVEMPLWLPNVPAFVLRLLLGEMSKLVTEGQLVSSKKLEALGFSFQYFNIERALDELILNKNGDQRPPFY